MKTVTPEPIRRVDGALPLTAYLANQTLLYFSGTGRLGAFFTTEMNTRTTPCDHRQAVPPPCAESRHE
jgi:hypothetical protein